jgi:hypothetical protein
MACIGTGHRSWLRFQMFVACILVALLFCITTGQLEAFATLWDEKNCSPPSKLLTAFILRELGMGVAVNVHIDNQ